MTPQEQRAYEAGYTTGFMDASVKLHEQRSVSDVEPVAWRTALERIADPRNTHFGNDARVVAKSALDATPYVATPLPEPPDLDAICQDLQEITYNQAMRIAELEDKLKLALNALESLFNWKSDPERGQRCAEALTAIKDVLKIKEQP